MPACPSCGEENPERAKFCLNCGTSLEAPARPAREVRKTVSVVFSDVTGSTALGERLDPESLRRLMARYFAEMKAVLERHGGTVEKFIGDAVMAVFGIPVLHEDDALRACRAAAEMREVLAGLNKEVERDLGVAIVARTGVNTGEVVAGDPRAGQTLVTGDAVNTAARLEQAAPPGDVLIGDPTYRLVRDAVVAEPVQPVAAKGKAEPVPAYRLLEVHPTALGHARHLDSPMVGRDRELGLLLQAFDRAVSERSCHLFTVLGSAGVGKSRLAAEFLASVSATRTVLRGRCLPYGEGITFWPVVEVVRQAAGISDDDSPEGARQKLAALVEGEEHGPVIAERVGQIVGLVRDSAVPEETSWAVRKLLESLARRTPLVLVLDDAHWGEPGFLDLVEHVADWTRDAPLLLLCLARPELLDHRRQWGGGKLNATSILLEPLTEAASEQLIANLFGAAGIPQPVAERIADAAEGNPLFVEEMLFMLVDDGVLRGTDAGWELATHVSGVTVPPTIQALLAARLDRLSGEERAVLERASVVGKVFYLGAVAELTPESERGDLPLHLMALVRKELVRPHASEFGEDAFRFRHILIRDAAYDALPKQVRADLHERFASWLERAVGDRVVEYEEILGHHLEQSRRFLAELGPLDERARDIGSRAASRLASAGRRALARGDVAGASNLLGRAVDLLPEQDRGRLELLPSLGEALSEVGELDRAELTLDEAIRAAREAAERTLELRARIQRSFLRINADPEGATEEAMALAEEAIRHFESAGDDLGLSRAWQLQAQGHWMRASATEASAAAARAVEHARRAGDRRGEAGAIFLFLGGTFGPLPVDDGIRQCDELLARVRGQPSVEAWALLGRGFLGALRGEIDEGRATVARARTMLADLGQRVHASATSHAAGFIERLADDWPAAERIYREGFEDLQAMGEQSYASTSAAFLAECLYELGRDDEAFHFSEVSERMSATDDVGSQMMWRAARARVLSRRGDQEEAERLAREAVAIAEATDLLNDHADTRMSLAEVLERAGRTSEAARAVRQAIEIYERKGSVVWAGRARARLAELQHTL